MYLKASEKHMLLKYSRGVSQVAKLWKVVKRTSADVDQTPGVLY